MALGEKLKQARLEANLSQRQLCGDIITRNMLSLIENGSAQPSMDTLRRLAARLGKPVSYFLEEAHSADPNRQILLQARSASPEDALSLLGQYTPPDPLLDPEYYLLTALTCLKLAGQALAEHRKHLARNYLTQAASAGSQTPYYTHELERQRLLLCYAAGLDARELVTQLPQLSPELLLRAQAALDSGDFHRCAQLLDAADIRENPWYFLRGEACFGLGEYREAIGYYQQFQTTDPRLVYSRLEQCWKSLGDYQKAYEYACKQR